MERRSGHRLVLFVSALLLVWLLAPAAEAQDVAAPYAIYASTGNDGRIVVFEHDPTRPGGAATRQLYAIEGPESSFRPSDMVVGPDGLLYITDPASGKIWRMHPDTWAFELVYAPNFGGDPFSPNGPEGPVFGPDGPDDGTTQPIRDHGSLYFNTKSGGPNSHTGIWRIPAIAEIPFGELAGHPVLPQQVITPEQSGSKDGEGMAWTLDGKLLLVDRTNRRVEMFEELPGSGWAAVDFDAGLPFLATPADPVGIGIDTVGNVLVSLDNGQIVRFARNFNALTYSGQAVEVYSTGGSVEAEYLEVDAAGTIWLATATGNGKGGDLRRIVGGTAVETLDMRRTPFYGVALPPTALRVAGTYQNGSVDFELASTEVFIDVLSGSASCTVDLVVEQFEPADLEALIPGDATCVRYAGYGGRCIRYFIDHQGCAAAEPYDILVKFFSDSIEYPGLLHAFSSDGDEIFDEDILTEYLPTGEPTDLPGDPAMRGSGGSMSYFVAVDYGVFVNHAPHADGGPDQTVDAIGATTDVTLDGSGSSDPDPLDHITSYEWSWTDGGSATGVSPTVQLPLGQTVITLTVTDSGLAGGGTLSDTDTVTITVQDTTAPVLASVPADQTVEAVSSDGATVSITLPTATDDVDSEVGVEGHVDPASAGVPDPIIEPGSWVFPVGTTTITWTATDSSSNSDSAETLITVVDSTPPTITAPADITAEATSAAGAEVTLVAATATDTVDAEVDVVATDPNGAALAVGSPLLLPLGTTTVTWTATDDAGNQATATSSVTVQDTTAPVIGSLTASPSTLSPVNHKLKKVTLSLNVSELLGYEARIADVTADEPIEVNQGGDGKTGDADAVFDSAWMSGSPTVLSLELRAERQGGGDGRVYTIYVETRDSGGNLATGTVQVRVD